MNGNSEDLTPLPMYKSHKNVWALKIKEVRMTPTLGVGAQASYLPAYDCTLEFQDDRYMPRSVSMEWVKQHSPESGGYWVQYADGYESYCPGPQFEAGNTPVHAAYPSGRRHQSFAQEEIERWFTYHAPNLSQMEDYHAIRSAARILAETINKHAPAGADKTAAMRKLREAVMTANAAVALARPDKPEPKFPMGLKKIFNAVDQAEVNCAEAERGEEK